MLHVYAICPWSTIVSIHLHIYIIISQQKQIWIILKGCYFFYFVSFTHRSTIGKTSGHWLLGQRVGNIE